MTGSDDVQWPAFIKFAGYDELALVVDDADWRQEHFRTRFDPGDFLVDNGGRRFTLQAVGATGVIPLREDQPVEIDEVDLLVRRHFAAIGECCVAKLPALPIADALRLLLDVDANPGSAT